MQKISLYFTVVAIALSAGLYSCRRVNGIDNDQVIQTPYSLFFADSAGTVFNTNDGFTKKVIFRADGRPCRALCTSGPNILIIKDNIYVSTDNGVNFNHAYDSVSRAMFPTCNGDSLPHNQTMILDIIGWQKPRTYVAGADPRIHSETIMGVSLTEYEHGTLGSWYPDLPDSNGNVGYIPTFYIHSMTRFANGVIVGYDAIQNRFAYREEVPRWKESTANPTGTPGIGSPKNQTGTGLPDNAYCIGHINNRLIALINKCPSHGAWYSDDTGRNWKVYPGLPQNDLLCIGAPFEQNCLVGTRGAGLYILNQNTGTFQPCINGLTSNMTVRSIAAKQNIYKNGNVVQYVYISTDKGLFVSKDGGVNWTLTLPGNYTALY